MGEFTAVDYVVFFTTLVVSLFIGGVAAFRDRHKNTPSNYFLAGKKLKIFQTSLSFLASFQSSILLIGIPAEGYAYGLTSGYYGVGVFLSLLFAGYFIVPVLYSLEITSVNRYFELRYGNNVLRYIIAVCGIVFTIFYMGVVIYAASIALYVVVGMPVWLTVIIYTTVATTYTALGGMKAVIWTDVFQFAIMMFGTIALIVFLIIGIGGMDVLFAVARQRLDINDFRPDPRIRYQFWNATFGAFTSFLYQVCSQTAVQRMKSLPNVTAARWVYIVCALVFGTIMPIMSFQGVLIFGYFAAKGCDVVASRTVDNINEIVPYTVLNVFADTPGLPGLFVAALTCATLSTLSSGLNSLAAITYDDVICVLFPSIPANRATLYSKVVSVVYGVLATIVALIVSSSSNSVIVILRIFMGSIDGPIAAIIVLSVFFRRSTSKGMIVGGVCGAAVTLWLVLGNMLSNIDPYPMLPPGPVENCHTSDNVTAHGLTNVSISTESYIYLDASIPQTEQENTSWLKAMYSVSFMMFSAIGFSVVIVVGTIVSLFTKCPEALDERTVFSFGKCSYRNAAIDEGDEETAI